MVKRHPTNKYQRRLLGKNKHEKKAQAAERSGRVWRKLQKENLKQEETEDAGEDA